MWIEIYEPDIGGFVFQVTLLAEGVDRNGFQSPIIVDRDGVTLLAEGVDRNNNDEKTLRGKLVSPSSRRVWIEIKHSTSNMIFSHVTLLAEGVDRNC